MNMLKIIFIIVALTQVTKAQKDDNWTWDDESSQSMTGWVEESFTFPDDPSTGNVRTYFTYTPTSGTVNGMVIIFHGAGGSEHEALSYGAQAAADQYGFIAVAGRGLPQSPGDNSGSYGWEIDGGSYNGQNPVDEVSYVHALAARIASQNGLSSDTYKIVIGFSNGAGMASLMLCTTYPIIYPIVAHVAGFIDDRADYVYQNPDTGPYSTCASEVTAGPYWSAIGTTDFFLSDPNYNLLNDFDTRGQTRCPSDPSRSTRTTGTDPNGYTYSCYGYTGCPDQTELCVYDNMAHIAVPTLLTNAMDFLLASRPTDKNDKI